MCTSPHDLARLTTCGLVHGCMHVWGESLAWALMSLDRTSRFQALHRATSAFCLASPILPAGPLWPPRQQRSMIGVLLLAALWLGCQPAAALNFSQVTLAFYYDSLVVSTGAQGLLLCLGAA